MTRRLWALAFAAWLAVGFLRTRFPCTSRHLQRRENVQPELNEFQAQQDRGPSGFGQAQGKRLIFVAENRVPLPSPGEWNVSMTYEKKND